MSIVALAEGVTSSVTPEVLHDVAAKNNIKITSKAEEAAYLLVLQSADATSASVDQLPEYIDPRLAPVPTVGGARQFGKSSKNSLNAWSHTAKLVAISPTSTPLKGRSVIVKDNMSLGGLPYTCGTFPQLLSKDAQYPLSPIDATIVRRVLLNGATIVGTSTCENYSLTPMSFTSVNGPVHNPWLRGYNAGGSTSGGAALLGLRLARAAGVLGLEDAGEDVDIALGGDQAGSIRLPAAYSGVYGLKPTHGLIPYTGIAGLHPMIDYCGPLAHSVDDIATMLSVLAGYDGLDFRMTPEAPLRENVRRYEAELSQFKIAANLGLAKQLRVGIITESLTSPGTSPEVAEVVLAAATKHFSFRDRAMVQQVSVPMHLLGPAVWAASSRVNMGALAMGTQPPGILSHSLPHFTPRWPLDQEMYELLTEANPSVINVIFGSTFLSDKYGPAGEAKALRHVFQLRAAYDKAMNDNHLDVLITPTTPTVAPPHPDLRPASEGGNPEALMEKIRVAVGATNNTCPFNASGHPALSVPCGWSKAKPKVNFQGEVEVEGGWLPVGMQIIGRRWDEISVLKAAKVFELAGGGLPPWPGKIA